MALMCFPCRFGLLCFALACLAERGPLTNRMSHAATPYLARAARQPVSWQPWSPDAFALAARLDRPVLLYVGAEDCRWCAQMDREVYGDPGLGAMIDSLFVPVRVDRDERPDVARRYEAAVQALAGLRGLPLTVFLTPDGSPFFGGTYFPADDPVTGRGLRQILREVAKSYREEREAVARQAALVRGLAAAKSAAASGVLRPAALGVEIGAVRSALDAALRKPERLGQVVHAHAVELLLGEYARLSDTAALRVATAALDVMVDSLLAGVGAAQLDEPPELVRAAMLRALARGWVFTGLERYREAGLALARGLDATLGRPADRPLFADRAAYVIGALLEGAPVVGDSGAGAGARAALDSMLRRVYAPGRGVRHARTGAIGFLQDQVQVGNACLAAYLWTGEARYLETAVDLARVLDRAFADTARGGYFEAGNPDPAPAAGGDPVKPVLDDVLPGANAWAARFLIGLSDATGDSTYRRRAEETLESFAGGMAGAGLRASSYFLVARAALERR